jgi:elongation factor G
MIEAIAETDEDLMEKFFNGEAFTEEEFNEGLSNGISTGDIVPVFTCSAIAGTNIKETLQELIDFCPETRRTCPL